MLGYWSPLLPRTHATQRVRELGALQPRIHVCSGANPLGYWAPAPSCIARDYE